MASIEIDIRVVMSQSRRDGAQRFIRFIMLAQMTIQQMESTNAQTDWLLDGCHDVQDAMMSTARKEHILNDKSQFVAKRIAHILTLSIFDEQGAVAQGLGIMVGKVGVDVNVIYAHIFIHEDKTVTML